MNPPPVGYSFMANFFFRVPDVMGAMSLITRQPDLRKDSMDIRFQRISGFRVSMSPYYLEEGGQNLFEHRLPAKYSYGNLILERGLVVDSPLNYEFQQSMSTFRFSPGTVLVSLLNEKDEPVTSWAFFSAYPVSWSSSDLDANANSLVIETLELAYTRFQRMTL
jgi:phage tail-like protein